MLDDKQLYDLFKSNKTEFADNGFSERVMKRLPKKSNRLPEAIILVSLALGILLTIWLQGFRAIYEGIHNLILSLSHIQMPSIVLLNEYLIVLLLFGSIGLSMYFFKNMRD